MKNKFLTVSLGVLLLNLFLSPSVFAATDKEKETKFVDKVRTNITKLGTGRDAKVEVKMYDGTKLKGYVTEIKEDSFVVMNEKTGTLTEVPYPKAKQVKGSNLSTGVKIAIGVGVIVVLLIFIGLATRSA